MKNLKSIENKIHKLPPYMIGELEDYIDFLLTKKEIKTPRRLKQDWAGALKEFSDKYNSLDLQKKALEWRLK